MLLDEKMVKIFSLFFSRLEDLHEVLFTSWIAVQTFVQESLGFSEISFLKSTLTQPNQCDFIRFLLFLALFKASFSCLKVLLLQEYLSPQVI